MTADEIFDFAFGQLDAEGCARLEREMALDPSLCDRVCRLRARLALLCDDGPGIDRPPSRVGLLGGDGPDSDIEPPPGLAARTIERVDKRRKWQAVLDYAPARSRFRVADIGVAAGIFIAGILTLVPAVRQSQVSARTAQCASNLRQLGVALIRYATTHETFPFSAPSPSAPYAGTFAAQLHEQGFLHDTGLLDCPCNGRSQLPKVLPTFAEIESLETRSPRATPCLLHMDYAYNIGYYRESGLLPLPFGLPGHVPLMADRPVTNAVGHALAGNSANHGGRGQNVLFVDGRVRFLRTTRYGDDDDIYHNRRAATAPGIDSNDHVLASGITRYDGK